VFIKKKKKYKFFVNNFKNFKLLTKNLSFLNKKLIKGLKSYKLKRKKIIDNLKFLNYKNLLKKRKIKIKEEILQKQKLKKKRL
jgi:hypothetical protein